MEVSEAIVEKDVSLEQRQGAVGEQTETLRLVRLNSVSDRL